MRRGLTDVLPPLRAFCELATDGERLLERANPATAKRRPWQLKQTIEKCRREGASPGQAR